jgi:hypothetical protein
MSAALSENTIDCQTPIVPAASSTPEAALAVQILQAQLEAEKHKVEGERLKVLALQAGLEKSRAETEAIRAATEKSRAADVANALYADELGETHSPETLSLLNQHPGVNAKYIALVVNGKFNALDLFRLQTGFQVSTTRTQDIELTGGKMTLKNRHGTLKDYGKDMTIWQASWAVYVSVLCSLYGESFPKLWRALNSFERQVHVLAGIYDHEHNILPMVFEHHNFVISLGVTVVENWPLPTERRDRFCNLRAQLQPPRQQPVKRKSQTDLQSGGDFPVCLAFNKASGCRHHSCRFRHECTKCESKDHGAAICKK